MTLPTASPAATRRALRELARPHRGAAAGAVLTLVAATACGLVVPPVLGHLVDVVLDGRGAGAVTAPVLLLLAAAVGQAVLTGVGNALVARFGETLLAGLRENVVDRALRLPSDQVERAGRGELVARVSGDVAVIAGAVRTALPALAGSGLTVLLTVAGLAALDWRFALAGLLAAPLQFAALRWYLRRSTPVFAAERAAAGDRTRQILDSIGGADALRAYGLGAAHRAAVAGRSSAALDQALTASRLATRFFGRLNLAEFVGLGAILGTGYLLVGAGSATVGATAAAALYFHRVFDPVNTLLGEFGTAQEAAAGLARLVGVADAPLPPASGDAVPRDGGVTATGITFAYTPSHPVLHDVAFSAAPGEHVALVGTSGAGKTTLAKVVAGVHPPRAGTVLLGGAPVDALAEPRRHIALVTQEVHVFAGPLADDLRLAAPAASDADLRAALADVGALTWADALPRGLATVVGEGGHRLTTTEAQQLALARVLLADPAVVVLDEATADAGSAGARLLDRAAERVLSGRTALIVAHRLNQAAADRIVVLDAGRIVESGTHDALAASGGRYAALWTAWSGAR
ncbi:putative ABC transporter ATP-binding protein [Actinomadura rubteroloni]|uniref:Putative ABC transporter ATP-binding protein n=1 Tax=Actinomadura rubteroloni TaxID=1926885 RepID=A0A2P4UNE6_9ACTN|nr:ABC transporter ATP-binding protein [Actinomadura rubteroloni]POM26573.1 putative ABC transporter ATP-binding protein [Actinomadura rubteroloni]